MTKKAIVVIPARISSTRLYEKPLADLYGKTLIQRVYENAAAIKNADDIVIATDSEKILDEVERFGGTAVMTPDDLKSGSDRVYYTAVNHFPDAEIIVNLQGDEPFINTGMIDSLIEKAGESPEGLFSAYFSVSKEIASDESVVKVVVDKCGRALYFSRSLIPAGSEVFKKHIGIYVWKRYALEEFYNTDTGVLESFERLEQLRVLESGKNIMMTESPTDSLGIDTLEDVEEAIAWIKSRESKADVL
jgi:3-deoxy-manno-octulosonate cytidylyltransferase (CMP-KDO synthetase)